MSRLAQLLRPTLVALLALTAGYALAKASDGPPQTSGRLDYLVLRVRPDSPQELEAELDKWGESGWQVVEWSGQYLILAR